MSFLLFAASDTCAGEFIYAI